MPRLRKHKSEHLDPKFNRVLEDLYDRCGGESELSRTSFAQFLGVTYATYCNWRSGKYVIDEFTRNTVEAYTSLSDQALKKLVKERLA